MKSTKIFKIGGTSMIFRAYVDESTERQDAEIFVVGGFVGRDEPWAELEPKWNKCLPNGIEYFHATDCFGGRGQFEGVDIPQRIALLDKVTDLITQTNIHLVCYGIDVNQYRKLAPKTKENEFLGNKYVACFEGLIMTACRDYMSPASSRMPVETGDLCAFFVEDNEYSESARRAFYRLKHDDLLWWRSRIGNDVYGTKTGPAAIPLLQVADLGAFLGAKVISKAPDGRISWRRYHDKLKAAGGVYSITHLPESSLATLHGLAEIEKNGVEGWE